MAEGSESPEGKESLKERIADRSYEWLAKQGAKADYFSHIPSSDEETALGTGMGVLGMGLGTLLGIANSPGVERILTTGNLGGDIPNAIGVLIAGALVVDGLSVVADTVTQMVGKPFYNMARDEGRIHEGNTPNPRWLPKSKGKK